MKPPSFRKFSGLSHCESCGELKPSAELRRKICPHCRLVDREDIENVMVSADNRALARAGRTLLESMAAAKKGEPMLPDTISAAIDRLGGRSAFGVLIAEELLKAKGDESVMTPLDKAKWKYSPQAVFKYMELLARMENQHDERETLDVESLSQEDLVDGLRNLTIDMVQTSPDYRRFILEMCIKAEPELAHIAMSLAGLGEPIDGKATAIEEQPQEEAGDDLDYEEPD